MFSGTTVWYSPSAQGGCTVWYSLAPMCVIAHVDKVWALCKVLWQLYGV